MEGSGAGEISSSRAGGVKLSVLREWMEVVCSRLAWIVIFSSGFVAGAWAEQLTGPEIREKVVGHSFAWKSDAFNESGVTRYYADGTVITKIDGYSTEIGKWRIEGDEICAKLGRNKENCSAVTQLDGEKFFWEFHQATGVLQD
jgi:hypothetical protein